jgi:uncharacterized protein YjbI with pentapeptide repeats
MLVKNIFCVCFFIFFVSLVEAGECEIAWEQKDKNLFKTTNTLPKSGEDLSNRIFIKFNFFGNINEDFQIRNVKFDGSTFKEAVLKDVLFFDCSFKNVTFEKLDAREYSQFINCDFTDARLIKTSFHYISLQSLKQTQNFKNKDLSKVYIEELGISDDEKSLRKNGYNVFDKPADFSVDFTDFNLQYSNITVHRLVKGNWKFICNNANIEGAILEGRGINGEKNNGLWTKENLYSTANYQKKNIKEVTFNRMDLTNVNFEHFDLSDCTFAFCDLTGADFTDAIITGCKFIALENSPSKNITSEQLNSTWNYKNNSKENIEIIDKKVPPRIIPKGFRH